ncbi:hypothetical protein [Paraburkholderia strydomiana]|uniref:hypothetical protein n=1 Tax=Paraburkholderia strydomiana TaxID=1245417 RepID=UPI0038BBFBA2
METIGQSRVGTAPLPDPTRLIVRAGFIFDSGDRIVSDFSGIPRPDDRDGPHQDGAQPRKPICFRILRRTIT